MKYQKVKINIKENDSGILYYLEDFNLNNKYFYVLNFKEHQTIEFYLKIQEYILVPLYTSEENSYIINGTEVILDNFGFKSNNRKVKIKSLSKNTLLMITESKLLGPLRINLKKLERLFFVKVKKSNLSRGFHAHKLGNQNLFCIKGSFDVFTINSKRSTNRKIFPFDFIDIPSKTWIELKNFDKNSLYLCVCDDKYSKNDYIHNKELFLSIIK